MNGVTEPLQTENLAEDAPISATRVKPTSIDTPQPQRRSARSFRIQHGSHARETAIQPGQIFGERVVDRGGGLGKLLQHAAH